MFQGRILSNFLQLKMGVHSQQTPTPSSQKDQDVLEPTEMIIQGDRKNAMQKHIKYKALKDEKNQQVEAQTSRLRARFTA